MSVRTALKIRHQSLNIEMVLVGLLSVYQSLKYVRPHQERPDPTKSEFHIQKMILKIVVWNQLSSKKICRTSFEITVLSYIT